ncbi:RNA polymerase sigma factor SigM [Streptomyces oceani]|uniref:RNA polymerase sigma factor SigM n=1 Tax=Streptomyces oceani TaxID=1075402 RepID=UPI0009A0C37F|nr:RNA polymerase sigma factor SigM [Streptomyces oceani]
MATDGEPPAAAGEVTAVSDRELLERHVDGDPDAFNELVRRHRDRLWAVAVRTLGDRDEAADAVQDALVSAYRAAHTFRGRSAVTTWLHRITVNACLDRARKTASRRTTFTDDTERLEQLIDPHESAAAPAERRDLHRQLVSVLGQLSADQRAALVLVDMHGYSVSEAAEMLGVAVGTIKSRCARGRARLLPLLSHLRPEGSETPARTRRDTSPSGEDGPGATHAHTPRNPSPRTSVPSTRHGDTDTRKTGTVKDGGGTHT